MATTTEQGMDFETLALAVVKARRLAKQKEQTYYVVYESGQYSVADETELETFFCGISDRNILHCTADR
jgi:hypothetical protein